MEYYHNILKPLFAQWAYVWLQNQHLYGIDKDEAISYMLDGAAARTDVLKKVKKIDSAINRLSHQYEKSEDLIAVEKRELEIAKYIGENHAQLVMLISCLFFFY
jgi:hypothetical protein